MIDFSKLRGNIFGGITAGVIALPLSLAFGVSSGLGAMAGLYGAIFLSLFASIFGGTPTQISGPTGPMTVVIASMLVQYPGDFKLIFATIFLAGVFQIIFGLTKLGGIIKYVPYPVISGFMSGIGAIIILLQLNPIFGLDFNGTPAESLIYFVKHISMMNHSSLCLGLLTLCIIFLTPKKISKIIPSSLIALILVTLFSVINNFNVTTIGNIPRGLPTVQLGMISLSDIQIILPLALTLGILGSIDSLLTSLVADSLTKTKHNSNQELIGQGIGNIAASIFGGIAGAGATMRTVVNIKAGGSSRLSGIVQAIFLICVILFFAPFASKIPLTVLAGILVKVGIDIVDYKFLNIIKVAPRRDILVMLTVFLITVLDDLIFAVGVGVVLSALLLAYKLSQQMEMEISKPDEDFIEEDNNKDLIIAHIKGVLFFGTASLLLSKMENLLHHKNLIINCESIKSMDISAIFALEEMVAQLKEQGVEIVLVISNKKLKERLFDTGLNKLMAEWQIVPSLDKAMSLIRN